MVIGLLGWTTELTFLPLKTYPAFDHVIATCCLLTLQKKPACIHPREGSSIWIAWYPSHFGRKSWVWGYSTESSVGGHRFALVLGIKDHICRIQSIVFTYIFHLKHTWLWYLPAVSMITLLKNDHSSQVWAELSTQPSPTSCATVSKGNV